MSSKIQGTVKWFSNKKGFGFITPSEGSPVSEDVFVHQSSVSSDGYRTLSEGWTVEFTVVDDSDGRIKAENVTAPGGGVCTGPVRRRNKNKEDDAIKGDSENKAADEPKFAKKKNSRGGKKGGKSEKPESSTFWHAILTSDVKASLETKSIRSSTGTIDVSVGDFRFKLGSGGYSSCAHASGKLGEGTFTCDEAGQANMTWQKAISFENGEWKAKTVEECGLPVTISLADDAVTNVKPDETALTLWGDVPTDPRTALEANGFLMRRVVLTPKGSR